MTEALERGTRVRINDGVTDDYPEEDGARYLDHSGKLGTVQRDWEDGLVSILLDGARNSMLFNRSEFEVI